MPDNPAPTISTSTCSPSLTRRMLHRCRFYRVQLVTQGFWRFSSESFSVAELCCAGRRRAQLLNALLDPVRECREVRHRLTVGVDPDRDHPVVREDRDPTVCSAASGTTG